MNSVNFTDNNKVISLCDFTGTEKEFMAIHKWLTDPEILVFYEGRDKNFTLEEIKAKYRKKIELDNVYPTVIKVDDLIIGYLQYYIIPQEGQWRYDHFEIEYLPDMYSIDILIGEKDYWGKGIGSLVLNKLAQYLFTKNNASKVYIDPRVVNSRAVRSYEKAGFKKIKILRNHEFFEGRKRDSWLMEFKLEEYVF